MGKNPCPVCSTPEAKFIEGRLHCSGCGLRVSLHDITAYLRGDRKRICFDTATKAYEMLHPRGLPLVAFGEWLMQENLELIGKP